MLMKIKPGLSQFARLLRRQQTDAERKLWRDLRSKQFEAMKFRRQQPLGTYIVDFVSFEKKLVIELGCVEVMLPCRLASKYRTLC